jgi:phosphomannomutase
MGEALSEETTLALATEIKLSRKIGAVVTNISTSSAIDEIAARYGASVIRTPVGQAYISEAMLEYGAVIGGEGSGGVALPEVQATHDSAATVGLILERMAQGGERVSEMIAGLPRLKMVKHNLAVEPNRIYSILQRFRREVEGETFARHDLIDGIKILWPDGWVHVRASNTESMIRIIAEAKETSRAHELLAWARDRLRRQ